MACLTDEERTIISEQISNQEGRKYPCSNQVVVCGFFSSEEDWNKFVNNNLDKIAIRRKDEIVFDDKERWCYFSYFDFSQRGYRFYKIKVSSNIDRTIFLEHIYPLCALYCKEIEWL